jgi:NAD-dependent SIR2 family protein deacetylase
MSAVDAVLEAAQVLAAAERVLIATGAGMSKECGIPTYRDEDGVYRDFEPFASRGVNPQEIANPPGFMAHPGRAWGFYEYMRRSVDEAKLHDGYGVVTRWIRTLGDRGFVLTTNIDDLHLRAGLPRHQLWRRYGSLFELQCLEQSQPRCRDRWWRDERVPLCDLDDDLRAETRPACPFCGGPARPRTQMALDEGFLEDEPAATRYDAWRADGEPDALVVIGTTLWFSWPDGVPQPRIISINVDESQHAHYDDVIAITAPASDALVAIDGLRRLLRA